MAAWSPLSSSSLLRASRARRIRRATTPSVRTLHPGGSVQHPLQHLSLSDSEQRLPSVSVGFDAFGLIRSPLDIRLRVEPRCQGRRAIIRRRGRGGESLARVKGARLTPETQIPGAAVPCQAPALATSPLKRGGGPSVQRACSGSELLTGCSRRPAVWDPPAFAQNRVSRYTANANA